jgi:hypothetical protein
VLGLAACLALPAARAEIPAPDSEKAKRIKPEWLNPDTVQPCNMFPNTPGFDYETCLRVYARSLPPAPKDAAERRDVGEFYDPEKYYQCRGVKEGNISGCEYLLARRQPSAEVWPYHEVSPVRWPAAPAEPVYRAGMSPLEYWRALCRAEAGEFIERTVAGEEAIYQVRPRPPVPSAAFSDRYVIEDPYGYEDGERGSIDAIPFVAIWLEETSKFSGPRYRDLETPPLVDDIRPHMRTYYNPSLSQAPPPGARFQRFCCFGPGNGFKTLKMEWVSELKSRYGFTWRAIERPHDRELGIAGGKLAVVDLKTGEILGLRRGFVLGTLQPGGRVGWGQNACPEYSKMPGVGQYPKMNRDVDFSFWFIPKVVIPPHRMID